MIRRTQVFTNVVKVEWLRFHVCIAFEQVHFVQTVRRLSNKLTTNSN